MCGLRFHLQILPDSQDGLIWTAQININRININPNDYYNPVIDYYNPLLRFEPCLNQLGLILMRLILILILDPVIDYYNP